MDPVAITAEIKLLEDMLVSAAVRSSAEALDGLIADEFIEFAASGQIYSKQDVLKQALSHPHVVVNVVDFRVVVISQGAVLATYKTQKSFRSSIWRLDGDRWRILFHQGTTSEQGAKQASL